ncbi:hypothetical protein PHAVU_010G056200 [Phaseolus vulgaris]|uniref:SBP-type domain-containing protein n=1 Tax=Phaseolus vulgaris TaxID=3885 RepID=V7AQP4_PHAVU|nr:hypothetical protein PHAVU_010G056200g [Phaseolus vulgaris]ESW06541.1 hypothetical protein PHAVU_010G056200g [Phaseolus vulgaris]
MDFGDATNTNTFTLHTPTKEETGNNILWYSSWLQQPTSVVSTSNSSYISSPHPTTTAEDYAGGDRRPVYGSEGCHVHGDPHLTCLHLGKRHYFEDPNNGDVRNNNNNNNIATLGKPPVCVGDGVIISGNRHVGGDGVITLGNRHVYGSDGGAGYFSEGNDKRARGCYGGAAAAGAGGGGSVKTAAFGTVPRCQVEGCHVALVNSKEYHRRHRVCDMHSKAPKVVVLGLVQRFCQQCSRFHVVSEFDDSKRSCRRRLAGHNERRRKSSHLSVTRSSRQGCALSLLSFGSSDNWSFHADLSTRCSAALRELIAENRAALMTRQQQQQQHQVVYDRDHCHVVPHHDDAVDEEEQEFEEIQPESNYFPQHMFSQTQ